MALGGRVGPPGGRVTTMDIKTALLRLLSLLALLGFALWLPVNLFVLWLSEAT